MPFLIHRINSQILHHPDRSSRRPPAASWQVLRRKQRHVLLLGTLLAALLTLLISQKFPSAFSTAGEPAAVSLSESSGQGSILQSAFWKSGDQKRHTTNAALMARGRTIAEAVYAKEAKDALMEAAAAKAAAKASAEAGVALKAAAEAARRAQDAVNAVGTLPEVPDEIGPFDGLQHDSASEEEPPELAVRIVSNTEGQPLYTEEHGAFTPAQFTAMREALDLHPLLHRSNELDPINFGLSSGWAVQFNSEGAKKVSSSPLFEALWPYFQRVRLETANAWTWNILVSETAAAALAINSGNNSQAAAGRHTDDTLILCDLNTDINSYETDVLYMRIPKDMSGGLLEIWSQNSTEWGVPPLISIHPEENKLVRFRGDATHRVLKHYSPSGQVRVSSVIEQYVVPTSLYKHTVEFEVFGQRTHNEDLKLFWNLGWLPHLADSEGPQDDA